MEHSERKCTDQACSHKLNKDEVIIMIYYASWQHKLKRKHTYIKLQQEMITKKQILTYTCNHTKL